MIPRAPLVLSLGAFGFLGYAGVYGVEAVQLRMDEIERSTQLESRHAKALERELDAALLELSEVRDELESSQVELEAARGVAVRLGETEGRLHSLSRTLARHDETLERVASLQAGFDPETLDANLRDLGRELTQRWDEVYTMAASAAELAGESNQRLSQLGVELGPGPDHGRMWSALMGPVVQLAGEDSVGSGILLRGPAAEGSTETSVYVLTAWHVVRDIQGSLYNREMPVPVTIYSDETTLRTETAELLHFDAQIDVALLRLDAEEPVSNVARLAHPARLRELEIFDRVYAVGCPLGNDPIPTVGEVSATHHVVDEEQYVMINAPTYVGNSGGGIFDAETLELLGVFSKVYTHGSLRPTIVTHMGLVTPLAVVYDWLEEVGHGFLVPSARVDATLASAPN